MKQARENHEKLQGAGVSRLPAAMRVLVLAWGNPGRCDDGLGPALAARIEESRLPGVTVESDYQLTIEHAALAAEHELVVFVDAAQDAKSSHYLRPVAPAEGCRFTTHGVTPNEILFLARSCFGASPAGYLLGIRAHVLDRFGEELSAPAREDLDAAHGFLLGFIASELERQRACPGTCPRAD